MREASEFWERGERMEGGGGREGSEIAEVRAKKRLREGGREREKNDCFHDYNGTEEEKGWREAGLGKGYGEQSLSANVDSWAGVCSKYYTKGEGEVREEEEVRRKAALTRRRIPHTGEFPDSVDNVCHPSNRRSREIFQRNLTRLSSSAVRCKTCTYVRANPSISRARYHQHSFPIPARRLLGNIERDTGETSTILEAIIDRIAI